MPISSPGSAPPPAPSWTSPDRTRLIRADDAIARLARASLRLLDVRAEVEFEKGSVPAAVNIPILNNREREAVGTQYKTAGKYSAIALGDSLVSPEREKRVSAWSEWARSQSEALLFCARGGMRSAITQNWLREAGVPTWRVEYGYKALRQEFLRELSLPYSCLVLGGLTGSAKTLFLRALAAESPTLASAFIDLEELANHKGSSFGKPIAGRQPTQQNFENALALELKRKRPEAGERALLFEDESKTIGRVRLPNIFYDQLTLGRHVLIEVSFSERVEFIYRDYVEAPLSHFPAADLQKFLLDSLAGVAEKLGDERYRKARSRICEGFEKGDADAHRDWITILLRDYYDPMYAYAMEKKNRSVLFRGTPAATRDFLLDYFQPR